MVLQRHRVTEGSINTSGWLVLVVYFVISLLGCSKPSSGRVYLVGEQRLVSGMIAPQSGVDVGQLQISVIDVDGSRMSPAGLSFNAGQGTFSFQLRDEDLYESRKGTELDRILSMGNALPLLNLGSGDINNKADKYSRIEIMPQQLSATDFQIVPYFQGIIPLTRRNLLAGKDVISFDGQISVGRAGFVRIKVVNEAGQVLPGVRVASVVDGKLSSGAPLWHEPLLRPIFTTTGADGTAFIGPMDTSSEVTRYQILALAEGYCTFLSASSNNFSLVEPVPPTVTLRSCNKGTVHDLQPSFPDGLKYLTVGERKVVHTKDDSIFLRLDARTAELRGVRVTVYETNSTYDGGLEVVGDPREATIFQSEFSLTLPKIFKTSDSTEGKFIIKIAPLAGTLDGTTLDAAKYPETVVYGHKKTALPSRETLMRVNQSALPYQTDGPTPVDDWTNLKISSSSGMTNIVSGLTGGTFTLTSASCAEGDALGFSVPAYGIIQPVFKDCVSGVATFTADEVGFVTRANQINLAGARQKWYLYWKDKFGSVSATLDDPTSLSPKRLSVVTVLVDTARPVLSDTPDATIPLSGLEFFKGTVDNAGKLGGQAKPLRPADVSAGLVSLRLEKIINNEDESCVQTAENDDEKNRNGQSGINATFLNSISAYIYRDDLARLIVKSTGGYESTGLLVHKWIIGGSAAAVSSASVGSFTRCRATALLDPVEPVVRSLATADINFPNAGVAEFYMRYQDAAGHFSNPIRYTIPECTESTTSLCWQN